MSDLLRRKDEHLDIVLGGQVSARAKMTGFEAIEFEHCAMPEVDMNAIDLSAAFLGRRLAAPFLISSMTGGPAKAASINENLARAAHALGIAFAVGSQRVAVETGEASGLQKRLRDAVLQHGAPPAECVDRARNCRSLVLECSPLPCS